MANTFRGDPDADENIIDLGAFVKRGLSGPPSRPFYDQYSPATRAAHSRTIRDLEADAGSMLDLSDADLAELAERALDTPRAKADIANGSAGGIRPATDGGQ